MSRKRRLPKVPFACPCCKKQTLSSLGDFQICPECHWQDDGQGEADADVIYGGPNGALSLRNAQKNYADHGYCWDTSDAPAEPGQ